MQPRALAVGLVLGAAGATVGSSASAFEPPSDPRDTFTCVEGQPVPGHPGFPGIVTGVEQSFVHSDMQAAAAWSATALFGGPLDVC